MSPYFVCIALPLSASHCTLLYCTHPTMIFCPQLENPSIFYAATNPLCPPLCPSLSKNQEDMTAEEILQQTMLEKRKEALRDSLQICRDIDYPVRCV